MDADAAVVVPAYDEAARIAATVAAARRIPGVDLVVVVDDGSTDGTAASARAAGAVVVPHLHRSGKAAGMVTGAAAVSAIDQYDGRRAPRHLLFLDADLEATAASAGALLDAVRRGTADMAIAVLPPAAAPGGGHGLVVGLARRGIQRATGFAATQPLSGQRAFRRDAFDRLRPLAAGFGVETGLTIDALRRGLRVVEVPAPLAHRVTGRDWRSQRHRGRQFVDVLRALLVRRLPARTRSRRRVGSEPYHPPHQRGDHDGE